MSEQINENVPQNFVMISDLLRNLSETYEKLIYQFDHNDDLKNTATYRIIMKQMNLDDLLEQLRLYQQFAEHEKQEWGEHKDLPMSLKCFYFLTKIYAMNANKHQKNLST